MLKNGKRKRNYKNKKTYKKNYNPRTRIFKKAKNLQEKLIYYPTKIWKTPLPPRYQTSLTLHMNGRLPPASAASNWIVALNGITEPFNTASAMPNSVRPVTVDPAFYGAFLNDASYRKYRVFASKVEAKLTPTSAVDQIGLVVYPLFSGDATLSYIQASDKAFAKNAIFKANSNVNLVNYLEVSTISGISTQAIKDDVSGEFSGTAVANPANLWYWNFVYYDTSHSTGVVQEETGIDITVTYYVEFYTLSLQNF